MINIENEQKTLPVLLTIRSEQHFENMEPDSMELMTEGTLTAAGVPMEKLSNNAADWQRGPARLRMQRWLEELGDAIEVVFANNDDMALGAIDACLDAGMEPEEMPFIVGVDATAPALRAVAEGGEPSSTTPPDRRRIFWPSAAPWPGERTRRWSWRTENTAGGSTRR